MYSLLTKLASWFMLGFVRKIAFFTSISLRWTFSILDRGFRHEHKIKLKSLVSFFFQTRHTIHFFAPNLHPVSICRRFVYVFHLAFIWQSPTANLLWNSRCKHETPKWTPSSYTASKKKTKLNASSYATFHFSKCWPSHNENMKLHYFFLVDEDSEKNWEFVFFFR